MLETKKRKLRDYLIIQVKLSYKFPERPCHVADALTWKFLQWLNQNPLRVEIEVVYSIV